MATAPVDGHSFTVRLLRDRLHAQQCDIKFAKRGKHDRTAALAAAIEGAQEHFRERWQRDFDHPHSVQAAMPSRYGGLQAADYCLWALQRLVVRGDDDGWRKIGGHAVDVISLDHGST